MLRSPSHFQSVIPLQTYSALPDTIFVFRGNELLVNDAGDALGLSDEAGRLLSVGLWNSRTVAARRVADGTEAPKGLVFRGLRSLFGTLPDDLVALAGRALQLLEWDRTHRFCGACATPTLQETSERAKRCPSCGHTSYPRIAPAMMCLVTRGNEILLARNANFPPGRYSALAGFVEAGESIEDAVHREVFEEVGLHVNNLKYFASQSWPFPHSLMIAFTAEYAGGELTPNGTEIVDAIWCDQSALPQLPPRLSIARALIEHAVHKINRSHPLASESA